MKIFHKGQDISRFIGKITWSGSRIQAGRKLVFEYLKDTRDPNLPIININNGETILGYSEDNNIVFQGNVYDIEENKKESRVVITAYDNLFILNKSRTTRKFTNITAEDVTASICRELGIKVGNLAKTNTNINFIAERKTGYQIIMMAYTEASKITKEKYHPIMNKDALDVILKGTLIEDVVLDSTKNMINSIYKESIENMINQIMVTDEQGNVINYIRDEDLINKYSMIQDVYKTDPNKNTNLFASSMIKKPEQSGLIECLGDYKLISSYSVEVKDEYLRGKFYIKSDVHTFSRDQHTMRIDLEFENIMNEEKAQKENKKE